MNEPRKIQTDSLYGSFGAKELTPSNRDLIQMHLEEVIREYPDQTWCTLLGYCLGYYGKIDTDILLIVNHLQKSGKIQ